MNAPSEIIARLSEKDARDLRVFIGEDEPCGPSEITLSFGEGHSGFGLYVWLTEYPEEGALFFPARNAKTHAEETKQAECESPRQLPKSVAVGPCPREEEGIALKCLVREVNKRRYRGVHREGPMEDGYYWPLEISSMSDIANAALAFVIAVEARPRTRQSPPTRKKIYD